MAWILLTTRDGLYLWVFLQLLPSRGSPAYVCFASILFVTKSEFWSTNSSILDDRSG